MKHSFCVFFILLSALAYSECLGGARGGGGSMRASKYTSNNSNSKPAIYNGGSYSATQQSVYKTTSKSVPAKRSSGMSAWGIICIVLSVILFSVGSYYTFIFYPLLCKKERNYDMIELSNV